MNKLSVVKEHVMESSDDCTKVLQKRVDQLVTFLRQALEQGATELDFKMALEEPVEASKPMTKDKAYEEIQWRFGRIKSDQMEINDIAKEMIPEFHFLDHQISNFWDCEKSPIGVCVWDISHNGFNSGCSCYYCNQPVERK